MFFSLLKGDLLSNGIGLISHLFLRMLVGIALGVGLVRPSVLPDVTLSWVASTEVLRERRFVFIGFSNLVSCGVPVECPAGIAYGISLLES